MFRIKTDIRQYRCKDREKVERLIRNWVIRPSDLILDRESSQWLPIGEDPDFIGLFSSLDEAHQNQPATVVTERAADRAAADREATRSGPQRRNGSAPPFGILKTRSKEPSPNALQPPVAPEGVEGVTRDSDEITMMTNKTLDLLDTRSNDLLDPPPSPPEDDQDLEPTEDRTLADPSNDSGPITGRHDLPEDVFATAEISSTSLDTDQEPLDELAALDADSDPSASESRSNWNIVLDPPPPEDLPSSEDSPPEPFDVDPLRDTADLDAEDLRDTGDFHSEDPPEEPLSEPESLQQTAADLDEDLDEDLRETADLDLNVIVAARKSAPSPEAQEELEQEELDPDDPDLRDTADLTEELDGEDLPSFPTPAATEDDQSDDDLIVASPVGPNFDIDEDALDEALDDFEEAATAAQDASESLEEIPVLEALEPLPLQNLDMVSAGYTMDLPIEVGPSPEALQRGLTRSTLPEKLRDKAFTQPYPKKSGTLIKASYDLTPTRGLELPFSLPSQLSPRALIAIAALIVIVISLISIAL